MQSGLNPPVILLKCLHQRSRTVNVAFSKLYFNKQWFIIAALSPSPGRSEPSLTSSLLSWTNPASIKPNKCIINQLRLFDIVIFCNIWAQICNICDISVHPLTNRLWDQTKEKLSWHATRNGCQAVVYRWVSEMTSDLQPYINESLDKNEKQLWCRSYLSDEFSRLIFGVWCWTLLWMVPCDFHIPESCVTGIVPDLLRILSPFKKKK